VVLRQAVDDLKTWEDDVINKTETTLTGHSKISVPKRGDPYFRLHMPSEMAYASRSLVTDSETGTLPCSPSQNNKDHE